MLNNQYQHLYSHVLNIYEKSQDKPSDKGNLYLSTIDGLDNVELLRLMEISCVLSIVDKVAYHGFRVKDKLRGAKIKFSKWIDLEGNNEANVYPHLDDAHSYIKSMLPEHNILIHCQMDMSKSLSVVIAYLMQQYGQDYHHAPIYAKNKRNIVEPKARIDKDLKKFQRYERRHHPHLTHK